ncbi:hypothetical protein Desor_3296 [Desulfosporosinus orientis DSM 765]|uniref:Uncharacterized protein n=1 Tax=Desulfosporosinus orientis (strain ATCC 19365 / DSM 765 / NCIMB 8382 / VKM B-1628 / Singapore I) TaxID=768706 RepID=G7WBN8_DESOD|nr:hypothetical protein [Desulfosporosinus orientis]AET68796.1 hypothetical protein Desor_3296 [Desulfosporosinus orientis DSM 765]
MKNYEINTIPKRIIGMQNLEEIFNQNGYLVCQSSGEKIYNFDDIVAVFLPINPATDQVVAVHNKYAPEFIRKCVLSMIEL